MFPDFLLHFPQTFLLYAIRNVRDFAKNIILYHKEKSHKEKYGKKIRHNIKRSILKGLSIQFQDF